MSNSLRCYCACSILVRRALDMTILTTSEKFEFLSIESCPISTKSCSRPSKSPAISGKPQGALKGTNLRSCLSCHSCSEERVFCSRVLDLYRLHKGIFAFAFYWIALFTVTFAHLHDNVFERGREAISGKNFRIARNCLASTFKHIVMQMRKGNCEKGYCTVITFVWFLLCENACQLCTNRFASKCYNVLRFTRSKISRSIWRPSF